MALVDFSPFSTSTTRRWFDDIESHMRQMQQSVFKRSFSDCGMEFPLQLHAGDTNSPWKLLDDMSPFRPEDIQVAIAPDGKSISLDAKTDSTSSDGGKISRAISKRWAWSGAVDANKLKCYIKDGALMIEAPTMEAIAAAPATPIPVRVESLSTAIPVRVERSLTETQGKQNGTITVTVQPPVAAAPSSRVQLATSAATPSSHIQPTINAATVANEARMEARKSSVTADVKVLKSADQQEVNTEAHEGAFTKVHTGSVANARRLFEDIAEKEKFVSINKINASISEHKLRSAAPEQPSLAQEKPMVAQEAARSETVKAQTTQAAKNTVGQQGTITTERIIPMLVPSVVANVTTSNERIIPTTVQTTDNSLQTIDKMSHLSIFDDSLLSFERQFWENRVNAMKRFHETSNNFHQEFLQSLHWPNIFDDSRVLRSNFSEINKGLSVKENEITATEFKVALDVAGCPVENLSVRVSEDSRLVIEARWMDGFTDRLARREWKLPGRISDSDVKCTISSDGILVIKVCLKSQLAIGDKKIPIIQQ